MNAAICKTRDNSTGAMPDKTKKIMVADFTTFNSYFFNRKHGNMKRQIYNYLNHALESGVFSSLTGFEILTERITAKCCKLEKLRYRGIDRTSFYTDMDVHLLLDTPEKAFCWKGMLRCLCGFYPEFSCNIIGLSDKYDHEGLTRLTSYLVPVYSNSDVDHAAEQIWSWYGMKEALTDPEARNAKTLARRIGLTIQYLPVYEHDGIDSMVFFSDGELTVGYDFTIEEQGKKVRFKDRIKQEMKIPANTIVINTNCVKKEYSEFNIFHECIHYTKHYLAMRLQELASNDTRKMKKKEITAEEAENYKDPLFFMEIQANRGAFGLMLPKTDMQERIYREMSNAHSYRHKGELYDTVGRALCKSLKLPEFRVRARMIQLGHIEAVGAMNYVDQKRIQPFCFDREHFFVDEHVYTINECSLQKLCDKSGRLRDLIDSRKYIHADGHVVRNLPDYVRTIAGETMLTDWANAHVDECCLRFRRQYVQNRTSVFVLGRLCFDPEYIQRTLDFLSPVMTNHNTDEVSARMKYQAEFFSNDFVKLFDEIMHMNGDTRESISEKLNIHKDTLRVQIYSGKMSFDLVVALCLIWKLPDWVSYMFLQRTYNQLQPFDRRHQAISYILSAFWDKGTDYANEYLKSMHLQELEYPKK